jgi:hypothetical protein
MRRPEISAARTQRLVVAALAFLVLPARLFPDGGTASPPIDRAAILLLRSAIVPGARTDASADSVAPYSSALRASLAKSFRAAGFAVKPSEDSFPPRVGENEEASALASAAGCGWAAFSVLSLDGYRLSYRISLYESGSGALAAADSFTAVAGLGVLELIDESSRRVADRAKEARVGLAAPRRVVGYRVRIASSDEGASVSMDGSAGTDSYPLGAIEGGELELPYFPFLVGEKLSLIVSAASRRTQRVDVGIGEESALVKVPPLPLSARAAFYAQAEAWQKLVGAGGGFRLYWQPDWSFFYTEDVLLAAIGAPSGGFPPIRDELWSGFGWYLVLPPETRFRFGAQVGFGYLAGMDSGSGGPMRLSSDIAIRPADFFAEWETDSADAIKLEASSSYSLGTGSAGSLGRSWILGGFPALSLDWVCRR